MATSLLIKKQLIDMARILSFAIITFVVISKLSSQNVNVSGALVGNGTYATLGAAFTAINGGAQTGSVIAIDVVGNTTEAGAAVLNANDWTSLTIQPSGGVARTITTGVVGHLVDLNGADNVTINGINASGNSLTISNTATGASSAIRFIGDASNNIIQNCTILGSASTAANGVVIFSTGLVTGNDGNTINGCILSSAGANLPLYGIFSLGTSAAIDNSNITISNNEISNFFNASVASTVSAGININTNNSAWTISGNSFYQTATRTSTVGNLHYGVFISNGGNSYSISNNFIGGSSANCGGTPWTLLGAFTNRFTGIFATPAATATTSIQGNTIANFSVNSNSSATTVNGNFSGITVTAGNANIGTSNGNTIGSDTGNGSIAVNLQTNSGGSANMIVYTGTGTVNINNNIIGSINLTASTAISQGIQAILVSSGYPASISNNLIGSNSTVNSINASTVSTSASVQRVAGIVITGITNNNTINVQNNIISNLTQAGTTTAHYIRGITYSGQGSTIANLVNITGNTIKNLSGANSNATLSSVGNGHMGIQFLAVTTNSTYSIANISNNTISNLSAINITAVQTNVCGIGVSNLAANSTINNNVIFDLRNNSTMAVATTPPTITGIYSRAVINSPITISNNMISLGNTQTDNIQFIGIWNGFNASQHNVFHNSINIEGIVTAGSLPSFCFLRGDNSAASAITTPVNILNNILNNARTGGTGNHFAIGNNYGNGTSSSTGWTSTSSNHNVLNCSNPSNLGYWSGSKDFQNWKLSSLGDQLSLTNQSLPFVNSAGGDLHLNFGLSPTSLESGGTSTTVIIDFDSQPRPGPAGSVNGGAVASDIGADEFDGVQNDVFGPQLAYTTLVNSNCLTGRTLRGVTAIDNNGINFLAGTKPRLYYKLTTNANTYNDNTNATDGWKYVETSSVSTPLIFTFDYNLLFGGVTLGNIIQYFVVAQDNFSTPNVGISIGGFTTNPTSVALLPANFPITGTPNTFEFVTGLSTNLTIGASGNYLSLTDATGLFSAINSNGLIGNTTVKLLDATINESALNQLNKIQAGDCTENEYSLTILPDVGINTTLTTNSTAQLLRILANNVSIDGSNNGSNSRNLTLTSTAGPILFAGNLIATEVFRNFTLKNSNVYNGTNTSSAIIISDPTVSVGNFRNINLINNDIQKAFNGIYLLSSNGLGKQVTVKDNLLNAAGANQLRVRGIYMQGLDSAFVDGNNIGNFENVNAENDIAIWAASGCTNIEIKNNIIQGLSFTGTTSNGPVGINLTPNTTNSNFLISNNSIQALTSSGATSGAGFATGISLGFNSNNIIIEKNIISNVKNTNTSGWGCAGMILSSTNSNANVLVKNNFISDISSQGFNDVGIEDNGYGLAITSGAGYDIYHNTIEMNTNQVALTGLPACINITSGVTLANALDIRNNIFSNSQTIGDQRYSILCAAPNSVFEYIDHNNYHTTGPNLGFIGSNRATLSDIQTGFGQNLNSVSVLPLYTSSTDLHLPEMSNSSLANLGTFLPSVTSDIDLDARSNISPDMGADEFGISCSSVVSSNNDAGTGSLRMALECVPTNNVISIDASVSTIDLTSSLIMPNKTLTIIDNALPAAMIKLNSDVSNISLPATSNITINSINIKDLSATKTNPVLINAGNLDLINVKISGDTGSVTSPTYQNNGTGSIDGNCEIRNE